MEDKETKTQIVSNAISGMLMLTSIVVYLVVGFVWNVWHPGWIIVVGAGLVCGIIGIIVDTKEKIKQLDNNLQETEKKVKKG